MNQLQLEVFECQSKTSFIYIQMARMATPEGSVKR